MARTSLLESGTQEFPGNNFVLTMLGSQTSIKTVDQLPDLFVRVSNVVTAEDIYQPFRLKVNRDAIENLNKDIIGEQIGKAVQAAIDYATEETGETDNWVVASIQHSYGNMPQRSHDQIRTEVGCQMLQIAMNSATNNSYSARAQFMVMANGHHSAYFPVSPGVRFQTGVPLGSVSEDYNEEMHRSNNLGSYIGKFKLYGREYSYSLQASMTSIGAGFNAGHKVAHLASYDLDPVLLGNAIHSAALRDLPFLTREVFEVLSVEKLPLPDDKPSNNSFAWRADDGPY